MVILMSLGFILLGLKRIAIDQAAAPLPMTNLSQGGSIVIQGIGMGLLLTLAIMGPQLLLWPAWDTGNRPESRQRLPLKTPPAEDDNGATRSRSTQQQESNQWLNPLSNQPQIFDQEEPLQPRADTLRQQLDQERAQQNFYRQAVKQINPKAR